MLGLFLVTAIAIGGFSLARQFVKSRLRFVDAVRAPMFPFVAGLLAAVAVWPLAILPVLTAPMAAIFGIGTGLGTASGVKALKRGEP